MKSRFTLFISMLLVAFLSGLAADITVYYDNSLTKWERVGIHYWGDKSTEWPGIAMDHVDGNIWSIKMPGGVSGFLFKNADTNSGDENQTADFFNAPADGHIYKGAGGPRGKVTDEGVYEGSSAPTTSTVTASPKSGTRFSDSLTITLSANPETTIFYTLDGSIPTSASAVYSSPVTISESTTITTLTQLEGNDKVQTFSYTKREIVEVSGNNLITDYYKVNPDGKVGSNRTVNATFEKQNGTNWMCSATNALSNWTDDDLIAQGVARDIASAYKGIHEYPVVDSYAIYAAYDSENLYLGVQYVDLVWDLYGDGKPDNDRHKPWNMDGRLMLAFDLDPEVSFSGVLANGNTIWDADGKYNMFDNGTDCIWLGSTKPTSGTPGLFFPDANGNASYDAAYCKNIPQPFYGVANGLLPCIEHIWGQEKFGGDPEDLKTNTGFVDLIDEIGKDKHTFYEWKFPLSILGVSEEYIREYGIGVMVIDTYGQGAIGCTPYDPAVLDNAKVEYSKDSSSSKEKEDTDVFTYSHARIGGTAGGNHNTVEGIVSEEPSATEYYTLQGIRVMNPTHGIYIVRNGNQVSKRVIR